MINKRLLFLFFLYLNGSQSIICYYEYKEGLAEDLSLPAQEIDGDVCIISIGEDVALRNLNVVQSKVPKTEFHKRDVSEKMECEASAGTNSRVNCFCATTDYCNSIEEAMGMLSKTKKHANIVQRYESVYGKYHEYVLCDRTRIELGVQVITIFTAFCLLYSLILFLQPFSVSMKKGK